MTLFSLLKFARTLDEAEQVKKEHELFKSNLERVSISVSMLQSKAQRILFDKQQQENQSSEEQQQQQKIPSKFEQLMNSLNSKWQMFLIYIDNRTRLIMAQINFYKYTDQVMTVLESLEHEYSREEDWYEKSKGEFDPEQYLQAQLQIHNQKKQSFLKACNWARRTGETFQKYSLRNICDAKMNANALADIESNTKKIMDEIHVKEEKTIKSWTNRKNALDECFQYVIFEKSSKEALVWLNESENSYLSKFQTLGNNKEEMDKLYKEFCEFTDKLRNQQGYVNMLIELSPKLLESSIRYGNSIAMWANKVETRYKEFFNVMSKVQQAYGLQSMSANFSSSSFAHPSQSGLASPTSLNNSSMMSASSQSVNTQSSATLNSSMTVTRSDEQPVIASKQLNDPSSKHKQEILKQNEQKQKLIKKRQNIITEIIQTEKSYVQDLASCLETYYKEFVSNVQSQPEYLRGKESIIFGNLDEIYHFHKNTFLVELENYENMPEDIGHCFVIYADQFQIYVDYCMNKETSTKLLMEDAKSENYFERLQRSNQLKCSLDSYLIKPIQRITKYQLLLKDLLSCCEDNRNETKEALDVMLSVPKKANDAIHLSLLEGLEEEGLSKEALGDVLLQDKFQVWDSKQLIKKGKDRHVFLFETSLLVAKELKDQKGKLKYFYKFKVMTSEINITEHMEGDPCKIAVWTGRAPLSDHRVIIKCATLDVKQLWVKKIRELIQEKFLYMDVAMCEAGQRSNRNSIEMDADFMGIGNGAAAHMILNSSENGNLNNYSSAASNASSGAKVSNDISTLLSDYTTPDNIHLYKGQHIQVMQRLNNEFCLVQVLNTETQTSNEPSTSASSKKAIEVQVPVNLIKSRMKTITNQQQPSGASFDETGNDNENEKSSSAAAVAAKRKGSFKKWLRSSHRKFTSNSSSGRILKESSNNGSTLNSTTSTVNGASQKYSDLDNMKIKKVLSNSEDLKIKNWLIEEPNIDESEENNLIEQPELIIENIPMKFKNSANGFGQINSFNEASTLTLASAAVDNANMCSAINNSSSQILNSTTNDQDDQDDLPGVNFSLPPPMNVIKPEQSEQIDDLK